MRWPGIYKGLSCEVEFEREGQHWRTCSSSRMVSRAARGPALVYISKKKVQADGEIYDTVEDYDPVLRSHCRLDE